MIAKKVCPWLRELAARGQRRPGGGITQPKKTFLSSLNMLRKKYR